MKQKVLSVCSVLQKYLCHEYKYNPLAEWTTVEYKMAPLQLCIVILSATFFLAIKPDISRAAEYCVKSDERDSCPVACAERCHKLMYYIDYNNNYSNFTDNTTLQFLPGDHLLLDSTVIANVSSLSLTSNAGEATVICSNYYGGLSFFNITNLTVEGLNIIGCSAQSYGHLVHIALEITLVHNLFISRVLIHNTTGYGLQLSDLSGSSIIAGTSIDSSHNGYHYHNHYGGNLAMYCSDVDNDSNGEHSVLIIDSQFVNGRNGKSASGVFIHLFCRTSLNITLKNCTITGNKAEDGANLGIMYMGLSSVWSVTVSVQDCNISSGYADNIGGGLFATAVLNPSSELTSKKIFNTPEMPILIFENTTFKDNVSPHVGAAIYLRLHEQNVPTVGIISFKNCSFTGNALVLPYYNTVGHGGVAVHILIYQLPVHEEHVTPLFKAEFTNCNFSQNKIEPSSVETSRNGVLYVQNIRSVTLNNCSFVNNMCTGIIAIQSSLLLRGYNLIRNHTGTRGGGMVFCEGSTMHLYTGTVLNITMNNASQYGGGIFVADECTQVVPFCFFQVDNITAGPDTLRNTKVFLDNNKAEYAGSAIYGGLIDNCVLYISPLQYNVMVSSEIIFNATFHIVNGTNKVSNISSNPITVCFCSCEKFDAKNCSLNASIHIFPGSSFHIPAMLLGQRSGPVPGVVQTSCSEDCTILQGQQTQTLITNQVYCSSLKYTVFSLENTTVRLQLVVEDSFYRYSSYTQQPTEITVRVHKCPFGFKALGQSCVCSLENAKVHCNITSSTVIREPPVWIGSLSDETQSELFIHQFCPLGYCYDRNITIRTTDTNFDQDAQCAQQRSGLLCGQCRANHSLGFGSSVCYECHHHFASLRVAGLIIACAAAGVLLVFLLTLLNLTVSDGTLNGLIFYANIVQVNTNIFFPPDSYATPLVTFIAWLNLDFGINVCFYNGMDMFAKTGLQFVFPIYIWLLSAAMIYFSRRFKLVAKLAGKNAVKVLATLFLLSFGKLLRAIISAVSLAIVRTPKLHKVVWLADASIDYMSGRHILLLVLACVAGVATILYSLILTFIQCLRRAPNRRLFSWIWRLKPLFDAYTGPYKDKYQFWTGLLLLMRAFLFICFAANAVSNPAVNLALIAIACTVLMIAIQPGIYRHLLLGILECSMYVNLTMFSTITMFLMTNTYDYYYKIIAVYLFAGSALLTFLAIVIFHGYKQLFGPPNCGQLRVWCREKVWTRQGISIQPVLIRNNTDDSDRESEESVKGNEMEPLLDIPSLEVTPQFREPLIDST